MWNKNNWPQQSMKSEYGGILLELTIVAFLLAIFTAGSLRIHSALHHRFERIVQDRNKKIIAARR